MKKDALFNFLKERYGIAKLHVVSSVDVAIDTSGDSVYGFVTDGFVEEQSMMEKPIKGTGENDLTFYAKDELGAVSPRDLKLLVPVLRILEGTFAIITKNLAYDNDKIALHSVFITDEADVDYVIETIKKFDFVALPEKDKLYDPYIGWFDEECYLHTSDEPDDYVSDIENYSEESNESDNNID